MATFFIEQFGCRATQADAAAIERQLVERGYAVSADANSADVVVVNTCTVTAAADLQARQSIRTIHRENPAARVIVTGCYAQRAPEELAALEGVSWVVGNSHKPEIPRLIQEMGQEIGREPAPDSSPAARQGFVPLSMIASETLSLDRGPAKILTGDILEQRELLVAPVEGGEAGHTRPVLKIQDGCNKRCSYCVIPQVRGRSRSLAPRQRDRGNPQAVRGRRAGSGAQRNRSRQLRARSRAARRARRIVAAHPGRNARRASARQFRRTDGRHGRPDRDFRGERADGAALPHAAAIRLGPHPGGDASLVSRRALRAPRGTCARVAPRRGHRRGRDRRIPRRDRRRPSGNALAHRAAAAHVPARIFVFFAPGNCGGGVAQSSSGDK